MLKSSFRRTCIALYDRVCACLLLTLAALSDSSASMGDTLSEEGGSEPARRGARSGYPTPAASVVLSAQRRGASLGRKSLSMGLRGDSQVRLELSHGRRPGWRALTHFFGSVICTLGWRVADGAGRASHARDLAVAASGPLEARASLGPRVLIFLAVPPDVTVTSLFVSRHAGVPLPGAEPSQAAPVRRTPSTSTTKARWNRWTPTPTALCPGRSWSETSALTGQSPQNDVTSQTELRDFPGLPERRCSCENPTSVYDRSMHCIYIGPQGNGVAESMVLLLAFLMLFPHVFHNSCCPVNHFS